MALAPHWLDQVIGDERDPAAIIQALAASPKFSRIVKLGVDEALMIEDQNEGKHVAGPGFNQTIRQAIIAGVTDPEGNVPPPGA